MTQTLGSKMPFKDRLRELRTRAGMTQQELATAVGLAVSAITKMEAGKIANPRLDTLKALARVLECDLNDLGKNDDAPPAEGPPPKRGRKGKRGE
jgi:transcriptional regulator with XRE-family HTH domain